MKCIPKTIWKKFEHLQLIFLIKYIEFSFKYFDNYEAFKFTDNDVEYLQIFMNKLYGIEARIPKNC